MKFKFEIKEDQWIYVKDNGLPKDGQWCFLISRLILGSYSYEFGGYNSMKGCFYINFGDGGCIINADSVIAWVPLFGEDTYLTVID